MQTKKENSMEYMSQEGYDKLVAELHELESELPKIKEAIAEADLIICMDLNGLDRTGVLADAMQKAKAKRILFDHG